MSTIVVEEGETTTPNTPEFGFWLFGRVIINYVFLSTEGYFEEFIHDYASDFTINYELDGVPRHCLESKLNFTTEQLNESMLAAHQVPWYLGKHPMLWSTRDVLDKSYISNFDLSIATTRLTGYIAAVIWLYILCSVTLHLYRWFDRWFYRNKTLPYAAKNLHLSKWVLKKHGFVVFPLRPYAVIEEMTDDMNYGPLPPPYPVVSGYEIVDGKYLRVQPEEPETTAQGQPAAASVPAPASTTGPVASAGTPTQRPEMKYSVTGFYGSVIKEMEQDHDKPQPKHESRRMSDLP